MTPASSSGEAEPRWWWGYGLRCAGGYWWELSIRQVEVSQTLGFDDPRRARGFFEALVEATWASAGRMRCTPCSAATGEVAPRYKPFSRRIFSVGTDVRANALRDPRAWP